MRRAGADGLLVELDSLEQVQQLYAELRRRQPRGLAEMVPAARSVLLTGEGLDELARQMPAWTLAPVAAAASRLIEIPVIYDGPDLAEVAALSGLSENEVIRLHGSVELRAAFCGFAPGFAYLAGLPAQLQVPRRKTPRTQVPAGAVALAGDFSGVYPRASPGGWQLIGRTGLRLWDAQNNPPALLTPGTRVRFVAT